jgi:hypothetical protein
VRRPLRAPVDAPPAALRPLEERTTLFGLMSSPRPSAEVAPIAAELIERFAPRFPSEGECSITVFRQEGKPGSGKPRLARFWTSARWKKLKDELATERLVSLAIHPTGGEFGPGGRRDPIGGFSFGGSIIGHPILPPAPEVSTLVLCVEARDEAVVAGAREELRALIEEFRSRAGLLQACIGRWGRLQWLTLDSTIYELACGVHGQCTLRPEWQTRWLRAVTGDLTWLGPELASHLSERTALEEAAALTTAGDGTLRLEPRAGVDLDRLEQALADVLPSSQDWRIGVARMYGRPA